jgi:hypothetical protein
VWKPGLVDLRIQVAVGEENPMRVAGAAQGSGGVIVVCPEGKFKSTGASDASASDVGPRKTVRPWKRRDGSREPNIGYEGRDRFERQDNPMRDRADGNAGRRPRRSLHPGGDTGPGRASTSPTKLL